MPKLDCVSSLKSSAPCGSRATNIFRFGLISNVLTTTKLFFAFVGDDMGCSVYTSIIVGLGWGLGAAVHSPHGTGTNLPLPLCCCWLLAGQKA